MRHSRPVTTGQETTTQRRYKQRRAAGLALALACASSPSCASAKAPMDSGAHVIGIPHISGWGDPSIDVSSQKLLMPSDTGVWSIDLISEQARRLPWFDPLATVSVTPVPPEGSAVAMTDDGLAILFEQSTGRVLARIATHKKPQSGGIYDGASKTVWLLNADASVTVLDGHSGALVKTLKIESKGDLKGSGSDAKGLVFITDLETRKLFFIDSLHRKVIAKIPIVCKWPAQITYVESWQKAIVACSGKIAIVDPATKQVRYFHTREANTFNIVYDAQRGLLGVPDQDSGYIGIYKFDGLHPLTQIRRVRTEKGSDTTQFDPDSGRMYVAGATFDGKNSEPGSVKVFVIDPLP